MHIEAQKKFILKAAYWFVIAVMVYVLLKYLLPMLMPFIVAFFVTLLIKPLVDFLSQDHVTRRKIVSILVLLSFYALAGLLIFLSGARIIMAVRDLVLQFPRYYLTILAPALTLAFDNLGHLLERVDPTLINTLNVLRDGLVVNLMNLVTSFSGRMINYLTSVAGSLPALLIKTIISIVASFFMTIDYYKIKAFLYRQMTERQKELLILLKRNFLGTTGKYVRAYAIIMSVTFIELSLGFFLMGLNHPIRTGLLIALIDVLPVLGTGGVMIPWVIIEVATGNLFFGLKLFLLYLFVTIIRNVIEPKVVGQQIGLHPLLTLICIFAGFRLFGLVGLMGLPISATIIKNLNANGTIDWIK